MKNFKNPIPRNILASLAFFSAYSFLALGNNFWSTFLILPFVLLIYIFLTEKDFKTKGSAVLAFGIIIFQVFINLFLTFLNDCGATVDAEVYGIIAFFVNVALLALTVLAFFLVNKGSARKDDEE